MQQFKIRFWGVRGSIPTPGPSTVKYGGNTACVEIRTPDNQLLILDCGSGIRGLGRSLLDNTKGTIEGHIFLSHTHWDHIQGFPFFPPAFDKDNQFDVYAPLSIDRHIEDIFALQMEFSYFPVKLKNMGSKLNFHGLGEQEFKIKELSVKTHFLNHTTLTLAYRFTQSDLSIVYCTDVEPGSNPSWRNELQMPKGNEGDFKLLGLIHHEDIKLVEFCRGADALIMDSQYADDEFSQRIGWGHSTAQFCTRLALAAGVKKLFLFHFDPNHSDDKMDEIAAACQQFSSGYPIEVRPAMEGLEINITSDMDSGK